MFTQNIATIPTFNNKNLLETALTHRSALNEGISNSKTSNERLEFLGDAVLELITTEFLYEKLPDHSEGLLTSYRSALVKTTTLAEVAIELGLDEAMLISKGEDSTGGRTNEGLLADTVEAVIGAYYLDSGYEATSDFLQQCLFVKFDAIKELKLYKDSKSLLQEEVQAKGLQTPVYELLNEFGPDHDKQFTVEVLINDVSKGVGTGKSKQLAQQAAADQALEKMGIK
jgi:ribonuclease III